MDREEVRASLAPSFGPPLDPIISSLGQSVIFSQNDKSIPHRTGRLIFQMSHHSTDSGFEDKEYQGVITEFSGPDAIKEVEEGFQHAT